MRAYKAKDIFDWFIGIVSEEPPVWPLSRDELPGLRLAQLFDALKIYTAQVYCRHLDGESPAYYETLKAQLGGLAYMIPTIFMRKEDFDSTEDISDTATKLTERIIICADYYSNPNDEEKEFLSGETINSFATYLELLKDYEHIFPHVLGHLSVRKIYKDDIVVSSEEY